MTRGTLQALGLLVLRFGFAGLMLWQHGLPKLLGFSEMSTKFADPIGLGSAVSLSLAIFAEVLCAGLVVIGLGTRLAAAPLAFTMLVAVFRVHGGEPLADRELAVLYLCAFTCLMFAGPGRISADALIGRKRKKPGLVFRD